MGCESPSVVVPALEPPGNGIETDKTKKAQGRKIRMLVFKLRDVATSVLTLYTVRIIDEEIQCSTSSYRDSPTAQVGCCRVRELQPELSFQLPEPRKSQFTKSCHTSSRAATLRPTHEAITYAITPMYGWLTASAQRSKQLPRHRTT